MLTNVWHWPSPTAGIWWFLWGCYDNWLLPYCYCWNSPNVWYCHHVHNAPQFLSMFLAFESPLFPVCWHTVASENTLTLSLGQLSILVKLKITSILEVINAFEDISSHGESILFVFEMGFPRLITVCRIMWQWRVGNFKQSSTSLAWRQLPQELKNLT
jgi:hypothetical protein